MTSRPGWAAASCPVLIVLLSTGVAAQDQRAILELVVNGVAAGETLAVLRGSDALVEVSSLKAAGLERIEGNRETAGGREIVSLESLAPDITFVVDEPNLRVTLTAAPERLGHTVRSLGRGAPASLQFRRDTSAWVNYSVNYSRGTQLDAFAESAVSARGLLVYTSASAANGTTVRGLTNATFDDRRRMRRWTFGDALAYSGPLGGDAWLAGVTVAREFAIDPYFVRHPTLSLSTPIVVPSTLEVHVNGQVVSQEPIQPGRLDVTNMPLTLGRNDARIVVRDAFGGTRELSSTYYLTTSSLAPGIHDYQYSVGFRRNGVGTENWDYRRPVALGRHRVGVSNRVTLGGRGEVDPGRLFSGGPLVNLRLPVGEVEAAASLSRSDRGWGAASHTAFSYVSRPVSAGGSIKTASRQHQTLTANPVGEDPALRSSLFATAMGGPVSITFQHSLDRLYERPSRSRAGVQSTVRLSRQMEFSASVMRTWDDRGRGREVYAAMTVLFGRASASVSHIRDARGPRMAVDAQQPLPAGTGYGFQMRAERGDSDSLVTGVARFQGAHGRYELRQETLGDRPHTTVSAMGALVAIGGGLHATRPVQDSFALIRVPGVEGVRGFASNQEMGRTSRKGDLLVPDLKPYYGNTLDIADSDVPLEYSVPGIRQILAPPYRGGAVALFPVQLVQRIVGRVQQAANEPGQTLAYGELIVTVGQQTFSSPVGGDGEFYFENIPPGTHPATLHGRDSRCVLQLVIPVSDRLVVRLGTVVCQGDRE